MTKYEAFAVAARLAQAQLATLREILGVDLTPEVAEERPAPEPQPSRSAMEILTRIKERTVTNHKPKADHTLKCWPEFFEAIRDGRKRHDLRRHDRVYEVGQIIELREYDPHAYYYTGRSQRARITYMTSMDSPCAYSEIGLQSGFCILSLTTDVEDDA
jgi:hypothetical protein